MKMQSWISGSIMTLGLLACSGSYRGGNDSGLADGSSDDASTDSGGTAGDGGFDSGTICDGSSGGACDLADLCSCGQQGCVPSVNKSSYCRAVGTKQQGIACTLYDCAPGFTCFWPSGPLDCSQSNCFCARWCLYPGGSCPPSTTCQSPTTYNGQSYGTCQ
jgi:hypothetical protein